MRNLVFILISSLVTPFLISYKLEFVSFLLMAIFLDSEKLSLLQRTVVQSLPLFMLLTQDWFSIVSVSQFNYMIIILGACIVLGINFINSKSITVKQSSFFYFGLSFYFNLSVDIDFASLMILTIMPLVLIDRKQRSEAVFYVLALYINNPYAIISAFLYLVICNMKLPCIFSTQRAKYFYDVISYLSMANIVYSIKGTSFNVLIFFIAFFLILLTVKNTSLVRACSEDEINV